MKTYIPTIGIEVHAELKTKTKMFCNSMNEPHANEPNLHVCPICMGHPGTLPVINKTAVKHVLKVGVALEGRLASYTEFDRKNYFYPDIPKGYQISQYLYPLVVGGALNGIAITRVHLEEDTARSLHDQGEGSIIDYNRAGVPLMELVTEPVIHDAKTAGDFARELQLLFRTLGVSDAHMEKGEMRLEVNISVSDTAIYGTKVEVKNLNSFKSVEGAIEYETKRQIALIEKGEKVIQETRGWDEVKCRTFSQRIKESAHEYRYFPDPDLPKLSVALYEEFSQSRLNEEIPELPNKKRLKYSDLGLSREQIEILVSDFKLGSFFDKALKYANSDIVVSKLLGNYLTSDLLPYFESESSAAEPNAEMFVNLMRMVSNAEVSSRVAKDILLEVVFNAQNPYEVAKERNLLQSSSEENLYPLVDRIVAVHENVVREYKAGKESALQFLVGQGMKLSKGSANPKTLMDLFKKRLD